MKLLGFERDELARWRKGTWQQAYSGQQFYAMDPRADEIHLDDLIIGLSREHRYARQTRRPYVVAEHSVYVSIEAGVLAKQLGHSDSFVKDIQKEGLLHDGAEAWLGDIPKPLKHKLVMFGYRRLESKWESCVYERFGVNSNKESKKIIKEIDSRIVLDEIKELMADPDMWKRTNRYPDLQPLGIVITGMDPDQAQEFFTERYYQLFEGN